ncbi:TPA: GNAT family N-acetyltransferase [Citrobacter koseri]|uniref:GNAT family N-acetyltransferase n=1 Tax=Citrobacter TaxID=544 RepID=UPI000C86E02C|nr:MULTISPECIES: GNAT family N-acetyltransferase [Citrobacter]AUO67199.1 GNAT family N-acetyltransferase [Citrobacter freundii complex sp. CFNIH2]MBJ9260203.1 GNAT family N-acetyltransferase [Citrobacter amalonaticus]MDS4036519.1 GNAT family N-acetyltransferase [Citrobacter amalonaticus]MEB2728983.1 GNAT family N-acetyltransferase [Citrobacter koseri]MEC3932573.1 GNAT family N-acetyltransferase [Citrobacter farmeri]
MEINVTAPVLLTEQHVLEPFDCGNEVLDDWLRRRAMKNQHLNASRTFVICLEGTMRVVGYYSIATGSVSHVDLGRSLRQNMPDPIPVVLLGRLAVDVCTQGHNYGKWLLNDAVVRVSSLADQVGIKAIMVHAINEQAKAFYEYFGFVQSPVAANTLFYKI